LQDNGADNDNDAIMMESDDDDSFFDEDDLFDYEAFQKWIISIMRYKML